MSNARVHVFLSYSKTDAEYRLELLAHLRPLADLLDIWHDQQIQAGTDWRTAIDEALTRANLVILLISADFLASDFCVNTELQRTFLRWERKEVLVVPIIVRDCAWAQTPLSKLQVLCPEHPIGTHERRPQRDAEWKKVVQQLHSLASHVLLRDQADNVNRDPSRLNTLRGTPPPTRSFVSEVRSLQSATKAALLGIAVLAIWGLVSAMSLLVGIITFGASRPDGPTIVPTTANVVPSALSPLPLTATPSELATRAAIPTNAPPASGSSTAASYWLVDGALDHLIANAEVARSRCEKAYGEHEAAEISITWFQEAQAVFMEYDTPTLISEPDFVRSVKLRGIHDLEDPSNRAEAILLLRKGVVYITRLRQELGMRKHLFSGKGQ